MSPEDFEAELQDWADNHYLITLVPKGIPQPDRQDIAQESWFRVRQRNPATITDRTKLRSYGARVVKNVTVDFTFGRRRVRPIVHLKGSNEFVERKCLDVSKVADGPEEECDRQQRVELFYRELARLPQAQRQMLNLFHLEELSAREVARRRGVTENTVRSGVRDGVLQLMRKIRKLGRNDHSRRGKS